MIKKDEYAMETHPDLYGKIKMLNDYLSEIIDCESEVKKLKKHPIKNWYQYLSSEIYYDLINKAHLMICYKEITELFDDFKNTKNSKLKDLVLKVKNLSNEIVEIYVDSEFKKSYLESYSSKVKKIDRYDLKGIRFMKDF